MMNVKFRILSGTYSMEGNSPVVELFGRTPEGKSVTMRYVGFYPYFYVVARRNFALSMLQGDSEIVSIDEVKLEVDNSPAVCSRITLHSPWKVPSYRERFREYVKVLAADIPFVHRFIYDLDLPACVEARGKSRGDMRRVAGGKYTTDIVLEVNRREDIKGTEDFKPPLTVLSFDIENSINEGTVYTIGIYARMSDGSIATRKLEGSEESIIKGFVNAIAEMDPDIITGYNIEGYDIPHLAERAKHYGLKELPLGRNMSPVKHVSNRFHRAAGRVIADAWWNVKREIKPKQETLNAVAMQLLGEEKLDVNRKAIEEEWEKDKEKVMEYCLKDAELALRILEKINVINKYFDLSTVSKLPLDDTINSGSSTLIDSILIREADRRGIGVPCNTYGRKTEEITGGYVHSLQAGLYHWVLVLDFKSMYPSIMISNNICFTTISDRGSIVCRETGVRFLPPEERKGLIPEILASLMDRRDEVKALLKEARKKGDEEMARYYDGLQGAIKILMNSFYGVFASSFYRFTNQKIGASITAFARENIKYVISTLEKEGYNVIYSDTDSVFFQPKKREDITLDEVVELGKRVSERFSREGRVLEFEKVLNPFFTHGAKKRYVGKIVWPEQSTIVRGYEIRRTDSFDLQSEALETLFDYVLNNRIDEGLEYAKGIIKRILKGDVPVEKLVISKSVRDLRHYKNAGSLPHVKAAIKLKEMGEEFVPGMKVSFVVISSGKDQDVEPYLPGRDFPYTPDYRYYAERVAQSLARVTEVFGWSEKDLMAGLKQSSLGDFQGGGGGGGGRADRKRTVRPKIDENPTLDNYF